MVVEAARLCHAAVMPAPVGERAHRTDDVKGSGVARGIQVSAEQDRLDLSKRRIANWKRWGPYLSERAWGTVREDYSADGNAWDYFPHDHARSRAFRWNEDGLAGIC